MQPKHLFFALFISFSIVDVSTILFGFKDLLWLPRVLSLMAIVFYGYFSKKQVKLSFWVLSFFIVLTGVLFSLNDYNLLGMLSLIALRFTWLKLIFDLNTKIDYTIFFKVLGITAAFFGVVLYALYVNSVFYYLSIATTLGLLMLLSAAFSVFTTKGGNYGNREMLLSIIIFIISDALSGSKKITGTSLFFIILSVVLYNTAYYFLMRAVIKNTKK
ncbi:hypothetical protein [Tenacibaculum jejuense]|uniref:YhhN-like protein n=1 Tax=Tenacibaculum jejuense TaxID=584609 RepID=A0A238U4T6_9FLAO|nr:hypothetical protein [Tenacibaculum jejuense]SNR14211.1 membrane protein of unknown function [Tenacibaculum jejuense]